MSDESVVWSDFNSIDSEIMFRKSSDGGVTFSSTINLSHNKGNSANPAIAVSGNDVHVTWTDETTNREIFYRKSTDGGETFGNVVNLTNTPCNSGDDNFQDSGSPDIALSDNNVYIVWQEDFPGSDEIFYRRSVDGRITFDSIVNFSNTALSNAVEKGQVILDKGATSHDDLFDCFRLSVRQ